MKKNCKKTNQRVSNEKNKIVHLVVGLIKRMLYENG